MHEIKIALVVPSEAAGGEPREYARRGYVVPFEDIALETMPEEPGIYFLCRQLADKDFGSGLVCHRFHALHVGRATSGLALRFRRPLDEIRQFRQLGGTHLFLVPVPEGDELIARLANMDILKPLMIPRTWHLDMPGMHCIICWKVRSDLYSLIPGDRFHTADLDELTPGAKHFINDVILGR